MSGLIWSGLGQGLAGAGQAFAQGIFKDIEYQRLLEAEQRREESALKRLEEADRIKSEREDAKAEALKQRVARESAAVPTRAAERGAQRDAEELQRLKDAGYVGGEMGSEEDFKRILADPASRKQFEDKGLIGKRMDPRLQRADDETQAALEMGSHSSVIEAYSKKRTAVLEQIKQEFTEKKEENRYQEGLRREDRLNAQLEQTTRYQNAMAEAAGKRADAATTSAAAATTNARANETRAENSGTGSGRGSITADQRSMNNLVQRERTLENSLRNAFGDRKSQLETELAAIRSEMRTLRAAASQQSSPPAAAPSSSNTTTTKNYSNLWK